LRRAALRLTGALPPAPQNLFDSGRMSKGEKPVNVDLTGAKQLWLLIEDVGCYDPTRTVAGWANLSAEGPNGPVKIADLTTLAKTSKSAVNFDGSKHDEALIQPVDSLVMYPIDGLGLTKLTGFVGVDDGSRGSDINPNVRFFVFTEKPDRDRLLRMSGEPPMPLPPVVKDQQQLIDRLFWAALSRGPNAQEVGVAREFLKKQGGLEDLLWSLAMHPEFQYVR